MVDTKFDALSHIFTTSPNFHHFPFLTFSPSPFLALGLCDGAVELPSQVPQNIGEHCTLFILLWKAKSIEESLGTSWNFGIQPVELNVWKCLESYWSKRHQNASTTWPEIEKSWRHWMMHSLLTLMQMTRVMRIAPCYSGQRHAEIVRYWHATGHWLSPSKLPFMVIHSLPFVPEASCITIYIFFEGATRHHVPRTWGWSRACRRNHRESNCCSLRLANAAGIVWCHAISDASTCDLDRAWLFLFLGRLWHPSIISRYHSCCKQWNHADLLNLLFVHLGVTVCTCLFLGLFVFIGQFVDRVCLAGWWPVGLAIKPATIHLTSMRAYRWL